MNTHTLLRLLSMATLMTCLLTGAGLLGPEDAAATLTAKANHDHISISSFYHGSSVTVRGNCDPEAAIIIKISSPEHKTVLKEKGKAGGLLWMNVADLDFEKTPDLYFLQSSGKVTDLVSDQQADQHLLGFEALARHISIDQISDSQEKAKWFNEFVKFKKQHRLYDEQSGTIRFSEENGQRDYIVELDWPYQAQPGSYNVSVFSVKDGQVLETAQTTLMVEQAGAVKYLANMAHNNGAMYGLISIIIALVSGFGTGILFKGGGAH